MNNAFLGIGTNLGDRHLNLEIALGLLDDPSGGTRVVDVSSIIETDPVGGPPQPDFLNGVVHIKTDLSPRQLLSRLQRIESGMGRVRTVRNGPRVIDLDILMYDDIVMNSRDLQIPHPRMFERPFVMRPLSDLLSIDEIEQIYAPN